MKHTPGPWFVVNDGTEEEPMLSVKAARIAGKPPRHEVALCATGDSPQEMENANARLIAAAPELLDALQSMYALHTGEHGPEGYDDARRQALEKADVAISKAEGK